MNSLRSQRIALTPVKKITFSGMVMAMYIVTMYFTQGFAFGEYQIRIATALYSLSAVFPFLILPMGLSNMLSNMLMGGMGLPDVLGGFTIGIITASAVYCIQKLKLNEWFIALPIVFGPGLIVPLWLSPIIHVSYKVLAFSLCIGQIIPGIVGALIAKEMKKHFTV